jgi:hypothetical protein
MAYTIEAERVPWLGMFPKISVAHAEEARQLPAKLVGQVPRHEPIVPGDIQDLLIPGPESADIPIRVYAPSNGDTEPCPGHLCPWRCVRDRRRADIPQRLPAHRHRRWGGGGVEYRLAPEPPPGQRSGLLAGPDLHRR